MSPVKVHPCPCVQCGGPRSPRSTALCQKCFRKQHADRIRTERAEQARQIINELSMGLPYEVVAQDWGITPRSLARRLYRHGYPGRALAITRAVKAEERG